MGVHTYGSLGVMLSRRLTDDEVAQVKVGFDGLGEEELGDSWVLDEDQTWGDIGRLAVEAEWLRFEAEGKVYDIPDAVRAVLRLLPEGVEGRGDGLFESDGEHWAIRVEGREVRELDAEVRVKDASSRWEGFSDEELDAVAVMFEADPEKMEGLDGVGERLWQSARAEVERRRGS
jgi:hypothetical protein